MIVADTSALVAIMLMEPERDSFLMTIFAARVTLVAAPTAFEYRMVLHQRRSPNVADVEAIFARPNVKIVDWTADHAMIAHDAFTRFGKGQGHPAQLNFGDCMSYGLAKSLDAPLLYKGGDFALTDVRTALP